MDTDIDLKNIFQNEEENRQRTEDILYDNQKEIVAMPDSIKGAITDYTYTVSINRELRRGHGLFKTNAGILKNLDYAFSLIRPVQNDIITFRGIRDTENFYKSDLGFVSTATSTKTPMGFIGENCCLLVIVIPKGSKVLRIPGQIGHFGDEDEILLYRNGTFSEIEDETLARVYKGRKVFYLKFDQDIPKRAKKGDRIFLDLDVQIRDIIDLETLREYLDVNGSNRYAVKRAIFYFMHHCGVYKFNFIFEIINRYPIFLRDAEIKNYFEQNIWTYIIGYRASAEIIDYAIKNDLPFPIDRVRHITDINLLKKIKKLMPDLEIDVINGLLLTPKVLRDDREFLKSLRNINFIYDMPPIEEIKQLKELFPLINFTEVYDGIEIDDTYMFDLVAKHLPRLKCDNFSLNFWKEVVDTNRSDIIDLMLSRPDLYDISSASIASISSQIHGDTKDYILFKFLADRGIIPGRKVASVFSSEEIDEFIEGYIGENGLDNYVSLFWPVILIQNNIPGDPRVYK